jgi:hypothetical protein
MKQHRPEIVWRDINDIRLYEHNAKLHPPEQVDAIAQSIKSFGFDVPLVLDRDDYVIKGEGRYLALRKLGAKRVATIPRPDLSAAEVVASRIADNTSARSGLDYEALAIDLSFLKEQGFDVDLTGLSLPDYEALESMTVPGCMEEIDEAREDDEHVPEPDDETAGWEKLYLKLPPETMQVFQDLMHRCKGKPHEQFEKLLSAVDVLALEELARTEAQAKR